MIRFWRRRDPVVAQVIDRQSRYCPPVAGAIRLYAASRTQVVGESYRQDTIREVAERASTSAPLLHLISEHQLEWAERSVRRCWFLALLEREPNNPHDPNAIAVYAAGVGHVGYLCRDPDAIAYQPVFERLSRLGATVGMCAAYVKGGDEERPTFGVVLMLSRPMRVIRDLDARIAARH